MDLLVQGLGSQDIKSKAKSLELWQVQVVRGARPKHACAPGCP